MKYGVRVALGALVGMALAVGLTFWLGRWWIGAAAGGLLGPVAFLATFFLWSADRPEEGYEQVLFDRPNTVLSLVMMVGFVGLAFGAGWYLGGAGGPALSPEEAEALAKMDESRNALVQLSNDYTAANDAVANGQDPGDLAAKESAARDARVAVQTLEVPESMSERRSSLQKAASGLESAFSALAKCKGGDKAACIDARIGHADATRGLQMYAGPEAAADAAE